MAIFIKNFVTTITLKTFPIYSFIDPKTLMQNNYLCCSVTKNIFQKWINFVLFLFILFKYFYGKTSVYVRRVQTQIIGVEGM